MTTTTPVSRGHIAYTAYGMQRNFRTHDDRRMPEWSELPDDIKAAWIAAAGCIWDLAKTGRATMSNVPPTTGTGDESGA